MNIPDITTLQRRTILHYTLPSKSWFYSMYRFRVWGNEICNAIPLISAQGWLVGLFVFWDCDKTMIVTDRRSKDEQDVVGLSCDFSSIITQKSFMQMPWIHFSNSQNSHTNMILLWVSMFFWFGSELAKVNLEHFRMQRIAALWLWTGQKGCLGNVYICVGSSLLKQEPASGILTARKVWDMDRQSDYG